MGKIGARQSDILKAVSTAPSINKTPVGNSTPPIPYPTTQDLSNSASVASSVKFNGKPAYVLDMTQQPKCKGDNPGTANGVKSGTVNGYVKPTGSAKHFRIEKHYVVRQGDTNVMNGGNNPGVYLTTQIPHAPGGVAAAASSDASSPPVYPETPQEATFLGAAGNSFATLGAHANSAKLLALAGTAAGTGTLMHQCTAFIPGQKAG